MTNQQLEHPVSTDGDASSAILHDIASRAPLHARDRVPAFMLNLQGLFIGFASPRKRLVIGVAVVGLAIAIGAVLVGARLLGTVLAPLSAFALLGLFLVNWIGNGGVLVPIPGVRLVGLLLIFQNALVLPPLEVIGVAGAAMALGLLSYYVAGARVTRAYQRGDSDQAEDLANESGVLAPAPADTLSVSGFISAGIDGPPVAQDAAAGTARGSARGPAALSASGPGDESPLRRLMRRLTASWGRALERAQPAVERHGVSGMFWLCFAPTPLSTAGAFLGGAMGLGFRRFLLASFAAKYLLAVLIVIIALLTSEQAVSILGVR